MTEAGYFHDMSIVDDRLTACESKLEKLEIAINKILKILEKMKK